MRVRGDTCHQCGMTGHWARACKVPRHLIEKGKVKTPVNENDKQLVVAEVNTILHESIPIER